MTVGLFIDYENWKLYVCFCFCSFKMFFKLLLLINLFFLVCQKSKNHIKSRKSKKFDQHCWVFVSKYVLPCTFVQMDLCIYEHSLFPMHLYHCGKNFEIFVTVVNRYSTLTWMISEWFCWSWDMHRLMSIYLPTLYFIVFAKKSSPNVNLQMKRDIELQKPVAHTNIWLGKRKSDQKLKVYDAQKAKG